MTILCDSLVDHSYLTLFEENLPKIFPDTDTSSANAKITAAPQITHTDTSSANAKITAVTQITHTDTSSANANPTAAKQISHTDTSHLLCKRQNNCGATSQLDTVSRPSHKRLRTLADGCGHKRNSWRTQPCPETPKVKQEPSLRIREKANMIPVASTVESTSTSKQLQGISPWCRTCSCNSIWTVCTRCTKAPRDRKTPKSKPPKAQTERWLLYTLKSGGSTWINYQPLVVIQLQLFKTSNWFKKVRRQHFGNKKHMNSPRR